MSLQRGTNLRALAEKTGQWSGAKVRICTEAGMHTLRERRQNAAQEDFEFAVAKVRALMTSLLSSRLITVLVFPVGAEKEPRGKYFGQQAFLRRMRTSRVILPFVYSYFLRIDLETIKPKNRYPFDYGFQPPLCDHDL